MNLFKKYFLNYWKLTKTNNFLIAKAKLNLIRQNQWCDEMRSFNIINFNPKYSWCHCCARFNLLLFNLKLRKYWTVHGFRTYLYFNFLKSVIKLSAINNKQLIIGYECVGCIHFIIIIIICNLWCLIKLSIKRFVRTMWEL